MRGYMFETMADGQLVDTHVTVSGTIASSNPHDTITITVTDRVYGDDTILGCGDGRNYLAWNQAPRAPRRRKR